VRLEFLELEEKILTLPKPHYYLQNPSNWGDALIHQGTLKFFNSIGLSPKKYIFPTNGLLCCKLQVEV